MTHTKNELDQNMLKIHDVHCLCMTHTNNELDKNMLKIHDVHCLCTRPRKNMLHRNMLKIHGHIHPKRVNRRGSQKQDDFRW